MGISIHVDTELHPPPIVLSAPRLSRPGGRQSLPDAQRDRQGTTTLGSSLPGEGYRNGTGVYDKSGFINRPAPTGFKRVLFDKPLGILKPRSARVAASTTLAESKQGDSRIGCSVIHG